MPNKGWKSSAETIAKRKATRLRQKQGLEPVITGRHTIAVDSLVWEDLKLRGQALQDTPNSVLRRVLGIDPELPVAEGGYLTVFQLLQLAFTQISPKATRKYLALIEERFRLCGWIK